MLENGDTGSEIVVPQAVIDYSNIRFVEAEANDNGPLNGYIEISGSADLGELGAIELVSDND